MDRAEPSNSRLESLEFGTPEDILNVLFGVRDALTERLSATGEIPGRKQIEKFCQVCEGHGASPESANQQETDG